jgi:hypothetical protein
MSTYVFFLFLSFPFHSVPFLPTIHLQYFHYRPNHICPPGGGALPDISEAVGVPYEPSAGLKP